MVACGGGKNMPGLDWSWVVAVKVWIVVGIDTRRNNNKKLLKKFNRKEIDAKAIFYYITIFCAA